MKRSRNPELTRKKILQATHRVLHAGGYLTRFSLDAVAEEAGVSKGGLLHHFGSKDELLEAAAQDAIERFEARIAMRTMHGQQTAGAFTRAYIEVVLGEGHDQHAEFSPILLSYLRTAEAGTRFDFWQRQSAQDGLNIPLATIIRLAVDGLIYTEMIDNAPVDEDFRQQLRKQLLALVDLALQGGD